MTRSLHLDDALFLGGEQTHQERLDDRHEGHVTVGTHGNGTHQVRSGLRGKEDGRGAVGSADDGNTGSLVGLKAQRKGSHIGSEDTKLGGSSNQDKLRIGYQRREVGHSSDSQEHQRRIPTLADTLIEYVQHGVVLVEADFKSCISAERNVAKDDAKTNGNEQQWLEVFLDGKPDEEGSHSNHNEVWPRGIGEARIGQELIKVGYDEFCERHFSCYLLFNQ